MYKIRPPYSLLIAALVAAVASTFLFPYHLPLGLVVGAVVEVIFCSMLFWKLRSAEEFNYESFYGQLLSQMTIQGEIYIWDILHLTMARVASYLISATIVLSWEVLFLYSLVGSLSPWWFLLPGILYLGSIIHSD